MEASTHQEKLDLDSELHKISHSPGTTAHYVQICLFISFDAEHRAVALYSRYFFLQNQACVHTNTCRGCLLFEVTKYARWPVFCSGNLVLGTPTVWGFKKEKLLESRDYNFTTSIIA